MDYLFLLLNFSQIIRSFLKDVRLSHQKTTADGESAGRGGNI